MGGHFFKFSLKMPCDESYHGDTAFGDKKSFNVNFFFAVIDSFT